MPGPSNSEVDKYNTLARQLRKDTLNIIYKAKSPHIGSSFSVIELLVALYFVELVVSPDKTDDEARDVFIMSKGHGCPALYSILAYKGFINQDTLSGFGINGGTLGLHPNRDVKLGIEVSTGSLGHGLSIGAGMALAAKYDRTTRRVFVMLGDGETNEGSVWEAAMFSAQHKLDNLVAIIDHNKIQALGRTEEVISLEPFADKWRSFGWETAEIDGHDFKHVIGNLERIPFKPGKPSVLIAHTVKGKGVSFMENDLLWHYRCPDEAEYTRALQELS